MLRKMGRLVLVLTTISAVGQATPSTQEIWDHHIKAWNARDLNSIVADYSDHSVAVVNGRPYRGLTEIRTLFSKLFATFDEANQHEIDPVYLTGKLVYIIWRAEINGNRIPLGTDTFLIENGKILYQTITSNPALF